LKRKKPKSDLTGDNVATTVLAAVIVAAALATPMYGWGPVLVVSGGLLAAGWVLRVLGGDERR
jgi:hypothetical protein